MNYSENIAYACLGRQIKMGLGDPLHSNGSMPIFLRKKYLITRSNITQIELQTFLKIWESKKETGFQYFLPRSPELIYSFFAILKNEAVACVLFSTFGESALFDRLNDNESSIIITKKSLSKKISKIKDDLVNLRINFDC